MKEESEKVVLKLNIQKTKIMASGCITSWQIDGETVMKGPDHNSDYVEIPSPSLAKHFNGFLCSCNKVMHMT